MSTITKQPGDNSVLRDGTDKMVLRYVAENQTGLCDVAKNMQIIGTPPVKLARAGRN